QNAIKYSLPGGPVDISIGRAANEARLSVRDYGIGIPEPAREKIFDRFYRASNAEQEHAGGMGIGLFVVKEIVGLHGGRGEVESQVGAGSSFTIWLPLAPGS